MPGGSRRRSTGIGSGTAARSASCSPRTDWRGPRPRPGRTRRRGGARPPSLGPDRFQRRRSYAERLGTGRLSRKEWEALRREEREARRREHAARKAQRGPLFGLWRRVRPAPRDPDDPTVWQPRTKPPARLPDHIRALAATEAREPSDAELKEIERAEKTLAKIQAERGKLEAAREKALVKRDAERLKKEEAAKKRRIALEAKAAKAAQAKAKAKKPPKPPAAKPSKGKKPGAPAKGIPVPERKRAPNAPKVVETGEGPLRVLTLTCPRCKTEIDGVEKRGNAPAKLTCPACGLVGKV